MPGVKAPKVAGVPSVSDSVAATVPPAEPSALADWTVTPLPLNSAQLRLNRFAPVEPPVTVRNTKNSSCLPLEGCGSGNVWLFHTIAAVVEPVDVRFAVVRIGPVIES